MLQPILVRQSIAEEAEDGGAAAVGAAGGGASAARRRLKTRRAAKNQDLNDTELHITDAADSIHAVHISSSRTSKNAHKEFRRQRSIQRQRHKEIRDNGGSPSSSPSESSSPESDPDNYDRQPDDDWPEREPAGFMRTRVRWQGEALLALQEAAEMYMTRLLEDTSLAAHHAKRVTIQIRDVHLVQTLRENAVDSLFTQ